MPLKKDLLKALEKDRELLEIDRQLREQYSSNREIHKWSDPNNSPPSKIEKKSIIQPLQKIDFSEINHEFRFLSLKKKTNNPKNSIQISLGLIKEDNLLNSQMKILEGKKNIYTIRNLKQKVETNSFLELKSYKLILSTATFRKLSYFQKIIFSIILILASYLSIF